MVSTLRPGDTASRDARQVSVRSRRVWLAAAADLGASSTLGRVVRLLVSGVCTTRQPVRRGRWPSVSEPSATRGGRVGYGSFGHSEGERM